MIQASAPGKAILFGEHAVVYDQPAIAVPLSSLKTISQIRVSDGDQPSIRVIAPDIHQSFWLAISMKSRSLLSFNKLRTGPVGWV